MLNKTRVYQRTLEVGHSVPEDKIEARISRALKQAKAAISLCDQVRALDNSSATYPFAPVFTLLQGTRDNETEQLRPMPAWTQYLLNR